MHALQPRCCVDFKPGKSGVVINRIKTYVEITDSVVDDEAYEHERYISGKHAGGDMYPPDRN